MTGLIGNALTVLAESLDDTASELVNSMGNCTVEFIRGHSCAWSILKQSSYFCNFYRLAAKVNLHGSFRLSWERS